MVVNESKDYPIEGRTQNFNIAEFLYIWTACVALVSKNDSQGIKEHFQSSF